MKKSSLIAVICSLLVGGVTTKAQAQDWGSNYSDCCPTDCDSGRFKIGAEWLYWKAEQDNLSLAETIAGTYLDFSILGAPVPGSLSTDTVTIEPNFKFTNGFRVNIGYEMPCDCWEANVIYTNLPTHAKSALVNSVNISDETKLGSPFVRIRPTTALPIFNGAFNNSGNINGNTFFISTFEQSWDLNLNQVDFDIARTIVFNDCISIRPHAGFRALWWTDKQKAVFTGTAEISNPVAGSDVDANAFQFGPFVSDVLLKDKFTGYGVEAGLWGNWKISDGICVVGHFGGSILYSKMSLNQNVDTTITITNSTKMGTTTVVQNTNLFDTIHAATPTVDYFLGLQYADQMCDMSFAIWAGWEQHVYFDVNRTFIYGNFSTQGLSLGLEVGF